MKNQKKQCQNQRSNTRNNNRRNQRDKLKEQCKFFDINCDRNKMINNKIDNDNDYKIIKGLRENPYCPHIKKVNKSYKSINNLNLLFNKFINYRCDYKNLKPDNRLDNEKLNRVLVYINKAILPYMKSKKDNIFKAYPNEKYEIITSNLKEIDSPMVIGLGEVSVREISIKLDHIFGIPFIPASSLKGAFRNFIENDYEFYEDKNKNIDKIDIKNKILNLLGSEDKMGDLVFLDTYPCENRLELKNDIMTPHYKDYYDNGYAPTDDQAVNPLSFLVVSKSTFEFNIIYHKNNQEDNGTNSLNVQNIKNCFSLFLKHSALGAKKAVGYGTFKKEHKDDK